MNRLLIIAFSALALAASGCASRQTRPEPIIRVVEVPVPVASPCVPVTLGEAPNYPDTDSALGAASDAAERYLLIIAGRGLRIARLDELEGVVASCPKATSK